MIEHECLVCGALMTDGWDICVDCLADTFGGPIPDPTASPPQAPGNGSPLPQSRVSPKPRGLSHQCPVCGNQTTPFKVVHGLKYLWPEHDVRWSLCDDCLKKDHHNRELRERFQLDAEQEELLGDIMHGFRDGTRRYRPEDTEDDGEE